MCDGGFCNISHIPPLFAVADVRVPAKYAGGDPEDLESFFDSLSDTTLLSKWHV